VPPEFECAICNQLLLDPVSAPCGHTFCRVCLVGATRSRQSCPLCRAQLPGGFRPTVADIDQTLEKRLKRCFAEEYEAKAASIREGAEASVQSRSSSSRAGTVAGSRGACHAGRAGVRVSRLGPHVRFGNRHEHVDNPRTSRDGRHRNGHRWTVFVEFERIPTYLISSVHFKLRPHFKNDVVLQDGPFEVTRQGWCKFPVEITVTWSPELGRPPLVLEHQLCFDVELSTSRVAVPDSGLFEHSIANPNRRPSLSGGVSLASAADMPADVSANDKDIYPSLKTQQRLSRQNSMPANLQLSTASGACRKHPQASTKAAKLGKPAKLAKQPKQAKPVKQVRQAKLMEPDLPKEASPLIWR